MSDAYFSGSAVVTIGAAGADATATANVAFTTYITNFSMSGGDTDTETINIFGGANIHKRNPRNEVEVSFDYVMRSSGALLFEQLMAGSVLDGSTAVSFANDADEKVVYVELTDEAGTTTKTYAFNNALCSTNEPELAADEHAQGSVTMKLAPTDSSAATNVQIVKAAASTLSW